MHEAYNVIGPESESWVAIMKGWLTSPSNSKGQLSADPDQSEEYDLAEKKECYFLAWGHLV